MSQNETDQPRGKRGKKAEKQTESGVQTAAGGPGTPDVTPRDASLDYVSMIEDPYGINTIEISEAQQISGELDLDDDFDQDLEQDGEIEAKESIPPQEVDLADAAADWAPDPTGTAADETELPALTPLELNSDTSQLDNLARAMAEESAKHEAALTLTAAASAEELAKELASQIAEDMALAEQLKLEAEESELALEMDPELLAALPKEPQPDSQGNLDLSELQSCIETLLFMMDKPVSLKRLQDLLGPHFKVEIFQQALDGLQARYQSNHHGFELTQVANGWQFRTKPGRAALAKKLSKVQTQRLSSGGMETLAICAYRQPVMKEEIDKIRGVDSSYFVRGLLEKKLIAITGRSELPGRPMLYSTTDHFLELFGLKELSALPSLREIEQMVPSSQSKNPDDEDPRVKEMRRLVGQMKADTSTSLKYDPREDERILKEIRERISSIQTSTPYLDEQKAAEKAAKDAAKRGDVPAGTQFSLESLQIKPAEGAKTSESELSPEMLDVPPPESLDEPEPSTDQA